MAGCFVDLQGVGQAAMIIARIGDPADVGRIVAFLASEEARYITGQAINVDGGQCMEL